MPQPLPAPKPPDNFAPYLRRDGEHPIAFFVDLNLQAVAPDPALPLLLTATVRLHHPSEAGFPADEEAQKLWDLEERLLEALQPMERIRYLGRTSSRGERTFAFQAAEPDGFKAAARAVEKQLPAYPLKLSGKKDPGWKSYLDDLFPPPIEHQRCLSLAVCEALQQQGDPLDTPREVDHFLEFKEEEQTIAAAADAVQLGFRADRLPAADDSDHPHPWTVHCTKVHPVDTPGIDEATDSLVAIALKHSGRYDGWGCIITKPSFAARLLRRFRRQSADRG